MAERRINIPNESLKDFANRYRVMSNEQFVNHVMREVTKAVDIELKFRLENLPSHPKDTGLLKSSWVLPVSYLKTHKGKKWEVYVNNTATVGQQARLKNMKEGRVSRKKKKIGRHNLKRYMPFVNERTKFYTKQLRVIRNKVQSIFKETVYDQIAYLYKLRPELASTQELLDLKSTGR